MTTGRINQVAEVDAEPRRGPDDTWHSTRDASATQADQINLGRCARPRRCELAGGASAKKDTRAIASGPRIGDSEPPHALPAQATGRASKKEAGRRPRSKHSLDISAQRRRAHPTRPRRPDPHAAINPIAGGACGSRGVKRRGRRHRLPTVRPPRHSGPHEEAQRGAARRGSEAQVEDLPIG